MRLHAQVGLEVIRHRRALDPQHLFGHRLGRTPQRAPCGLDLAQEHRPVDREMVVVEPVARVDVERPLGAPVLEVGADRGLVPVHHVVVVPAKHVDMRRHVDQVPGIRHQRAQRIRRAQRLFRERRHLHQVHVEVQEARVPHRLLIARQRLLQHRLCLGRRRALGRAAALEVPHLPGREIEQRLGEDRAHLAALGMRPERHAHGIGEVAVPGRHVRDRLGLRIAGGQRRDHRPLPVRRVTRRRKSGPRRGMGGGGLPGLPGRVHPCPGQVVVGPDRVGDAPMRHRAARIGGERPFETGHRLVVIVGVGPDQPAVEPALRFRIRRRHRKAVIAQIEAVVVHAASFAAARDASTIPPPRATESGSEPPRPCRGPRQG